MIKSAGGQSTITSRGWELLPSKGANWKYTEAIISN